MVLKSRAQTPCFLAYNEQNQPVQTFCIGERITFRGTAIGSTDPEFYDFDASNGLDFSAEETSHVFTSPGTFTVTQLKGVGNLCPLTFTVKANVPASPPVLQKLSLLSSGIQIQVQSSAVNDIIVERAASASGNFSPMDTLRNVPVGSSQHTLSTSSTSGCFRLRVTNVCTGNETITSGTVCSQSLQVSPGDRVNQISWSAYPATGLVSQYQLFRGGSLYQTIPASQTSFTDNSVACGRTYCYQLLTVLQTGSQSLSLEQCLETQGTTPPAAPFLVVSFNAQNQPEALSIIPADETFQYQSLYRSLSNGVFGLLSEKQPKNVTDTSLPNLTAPPCYQVAYTDSCNLLSSRSNTVCPAILSATQQTSGGVQLNWSQYQGFPDGIASQTLELVDEQGNVYWSTPVSGSSFLDTQSHDQFQRLTYRLLTKASNATYQSYSNLASVDQDFQFYFPTAFSPNGDGLNDVFRALGKFASNFNLQVLNRWGQVIFEGHDPQSGWDGAYQGKPVPPGTYLYRLEATDINGQRISKKGKVTLVR